MVMSPLAIPWSIISSIMKEVSPFCFVFLLGLLASDFPFDIFKGLLERPVDLLEPPESTLFCDFTFVDERLCLGPFSRF
jgi:hypothetical protein